MPPHRPLGKFDGRGGGKGGGRGKTKPVFAYPLSGRIEGRGMSPLVFRNRNDPDNPDTSIDLFLPVPSRSMGFTGKIPTSSVQAVTNFDYYISPSGNDSNPGTLAQPFKTIAHACSFLTPGLSLGMRGGTYVDTFYNNSIAGTSWANKVRIANYGSETVWVAPSAAMEYGVYFADAQHYIEFDGINIDGTNSQYGCLKFDTWSGGEVHHIRFQNAEVLGKVGPGGLYLSGPTICIASASVAGAIGSNEFRNLTMHRAGNTGDFAYAFYLQSPNNIVENCDMYDLHGAGVQIYNGYGHTPVGNIIRNNRIHDIVLSGDTRIWGILNAGNDSLIYNNLIYGMGALADSYGVYLYTGNNCRVLNNTVYNGGGYGITVGPGVTNSIVRNNIGYLNATGNYDDLGTSTVANNNLFGTNPLFVNAGSADFHIQSGSPARNAGTNTSPDVVDDFYGTSRPQESVYDIGAAEYV